MTAEELNGYVLLAGVFIRLGIDTAQGLKAILGVQKQLTDAELNALVDQIMASSKLKRAESAAIAFGA